MGAGSSKGGLRVHQIFPSSPAWLAGLEVFFDYIITANDENVADDSPQTFAHFVEIIAECENKRLVLEVYNALTNSIRKAVVQPAKWNGNGLLGARVIYEEFNALFQGNRVLSVEPDSPGFRAGLASPSDYIIATTDELLVDQDSLHNAILNCKGKLELLVYSSATETIRQVTVQLDKDKNYIGCNLGNGFLHQIPAAKTLWSNPSQSTQTLSNPNSQEDNNTFVEDGLYPSFIPHVNKNNHSSDK